MKAMRLFLALFVSLLAAAPVDPHATPPGAVAAIDHISADSLRGHLSFIASDALLGRDTPSAGLDLAAEYIAAQFRRAGLEPVSNGDYFQSANFLDVTPDPSGLEIVLQNGDDSVTPGKDTLAVQSFSAIDLKDAAVFKSKKEDKNFTGAKAKVALADRRELKNELRSRVKALREAGASAIVIVCKDLPRYPAHRLIDADEVKTAGAPLVFVNDSKFVKLFEDLPAGDSTAKIAIHAAIPAEKPVILRNVAGILRGSDPQLRNSYVLVTAHYDHLGVKPDGEGDRIFNGANDDGSGTVSVIEIASALASMNPHPKRSVVFMTYFGEEKGLLGSSYYARHPLVPLRDTVGDINLEQLGRTDDSEGKQVAAVTFTGEDFSDLPSTFETAGRVVGIKVRKTTESAAYFDRSDNQALADAGVPAHTVAVSLVFPDYHGVSDEWQKIDYNNMTKVDRMIALGVVMLADAPDVPHWSQRNEKAAKYRKAYAVLHSESAVGAGDSRATQSDSPR